MLKINLKNKRAFVAGIADDGGFGWAIAKALMEAGAEVLVGTWPPALRLFKGALEMGKFDESRKLSDDSLMEFTKIYPFDAAFDLPADVPEEIRQNKRYQLNEGFTISEVAEAVKKEFGSIDILIHSLANAPEVKKQLVETSRAGYLSAISSSSYSLISMVKHFGPIMPKGGSVLTLSYLASERAVPGYGGGMSSAKAALESDVRMLSFEAGRKWGIRLNVISAGALASRAAKAIGFIEKMIDYSEKTAPLQDNLQAREVGDTAAFLSSSLASGITGSIIYVDKGMHAMGVGHEIFE